MNSYCKQCGARLAQDARFCQKCGTKVVPSTSIASESAQGPTASHNAGEVVSGRNLMPVLVGVGVVGFLLLLFVIYFVENALNDALGFPLGYIFFPIAILVGVISWLAKVLGSGGQ